MSTPIVPRPPTQLILTTPEHLLAFGFGAGLAPFAPGTVGTLVGVLLFLPLSWLPPPAYAATVVGLFMLGCWICGESARLLGVHDYGGIVFDEIVGYLIAAAPLLFFPALTAAVWAVALIGAFALFRLLDILKPWPIRILDRAVRGGLGIMLDDALAGLFAAVLLWAVLRLFG
ncbi:phosphatidylglycerophosphatase [Fontimonas thermophila]|uniref:Phosphatidylglycerophosphatase A n=1 Tax=Fontimonas thermophila TaxID=1076937 RepID=A0A1I2IUS3_9GAMM|nr:phosphatidylglycerophosphatase A [Fontimonas thermophila]SFF45490.1 phosphatidylglycerophosphatase [Fontimonas thermophila]